MSAIITLIIVLLLMTQAWFYKVFFILLMVSSCGVRRILSNCWSIISGYSMRVICGLPE